LRRKVSDLAKCLVFNLQSADTPHLPRYWYVMAVGYSFYCNVDETYFVHSE